MSTQYTFNTVVYKGKTSTSCQGNIGEVAYDSETGNVFIFNGAKWLPIESEESARLSCEMLPHICKCCGAPMYSTRCDFCGVEYIEVKVKNLT